MCVCEFLLHMYINSNILFRIYHNMYKVLKMNLKGRNKKRKKEEVLRTGQALLELEAIEN